MVLQEKAEGALPLGIYCHIPFCATTCDFRTYYQEAPHRRDLDLYLEGMDRELGLVDIDRGADTVLWGGGTPGLLRADDLHRLGRALLDKLPHPPREWTVELAPSTVNEDKLAVLRELGVNRISLGVQSFQVEMLKALGCLHSFNQVDEAIEVIRSAGFGNLNFDLMFAIPSQSIEAWKRDLREAIRRQPEHISTYCLTFEEDTVPYARLPRGKVSAKSGPEEAAFYLETWETLEAADFGQYEISNFARPGYSCLHNLNTWLMYDWVGLGPSAASQYRGRRFANVSSLDDWMAGLSNGKPRRVDEVTLSEYMLAADCLIFGLRMNAGVNLNLLKRRYPGIPFEALEPLWGRWEEDGLLERSGDETLRLTVNGRLLADGLGVEILEAFDAMNSPRNRREHRKIFNHKSSLIYTDLF